MLPIFIPRINLTWPWYVIICIKIELNSMYKGFVNNFCINTHEGYWSITLHSCNIFVWFWYQSSVGLIEWIEISLLYTFLENLCRIDIFFFLKCLANFISKVIWAWSIFCGRGFNNKSNFLKNWCRSIQIICFFLSKLP